MTTNITAQVQEWITCAECGIDTPPSIVVHFQDRYGRRYNYCEPCYHDVIVTCGFCDNPVHRNVTVEVEGEDWCEHCANQHAVQCDNCDDLVWVEHAYGDDNITVCGYCYENYYITCTSCADLVHVDDAQYVDGEGYCPECAPAQGIIYDWDEGPTLTFYRSHDQSHVFYGVELEVERCDSYMNKYDMARALYATAGQHVYCKRDGSLDDGIEIVSHPADFDYHMERMPWKEVLDCLRKAGYRSHDPGTCGLHVHVSREAFGPDHETQLDRIHRLLYIVEKFWPYWLRLSRRTEEAMQQWAARYLGDDEQLDHVPKEALLDRAVYGNKYHAVNLQKPRTVEIRMFRGTLKLNTLRAILQLVHYLVGLATDDSIDVEKLTWEDVANDLRNFSPELRQYMKERGL